MAERGKPSWLQQHWKSVSAALTAFFASVVASLSNGSISAAEMAKIAGATVLGFGAVYFAPANVAPDEHA